MSTMNRPKITKQMLKELRGELLSKQIAQNHPRMNESEDSSSLKTRLQTDSIKDDLDNNMNMGQELEDEMNM